MNPIGMRMSETLQPMANEAASAMKFSGRTTRRGAFQEMFGDFFNRSADSAEGFEADADVKSGKADAKTGKRERLIQGSIGEAIKRPIKMALLRPRGWVETVLHFFTGISLILPLKHAIEGFFGVDSIFMKRHKPLIFRVGYSHNGRTLVEAFKTHFSRGKADSD